MNMARVAAVAALVLLPATAQADARQDLIDGMNKCAAVIDNMARLACYDALNPAVKAAEAAPPPPPPPVAPAQPPAQTADNTRPWYDIFGVAPNRQTTAEQFGAENLAPPAPPPGQPEQPPQPAAPVALDHITANVTDYSYNAYGKFVIFLDNGQIWRQLSADSGKARFRSSGGNTVVIERGVIGGYNLILNDGATFKVKREK